MKHPSLPDRHNLKRAFLFAAHDAPYVLETWLPLFTPEFEREDLR